MAKKRRKTKARKSSISRKPSHEQAKKAVRTIANYAKHHAKEGQKVIAKHGRALASKAKSFFNKLRKSK